jgi:MFS superfamily sulfate permease-like transporter
MERISSPAPVKPLYKTLFSNSNGKKKPPRSFQQKLLQFLPILQWLPEYPKDLSENLKGDLVAGLTVAVIAIPQTLSYASLASIPPIYGLYSAIVPPFLYTIFGTSRVLSVGIVAINALIVTSTISPLADPILETERYIGLALAATLFAGIISLLLGILKQGSLVRYVSPQVLAGFVTAAALVIIVSQLKGLFGVQV